MFRIRDPQESLWQSQFLVTPKKAKRLEGSWAEVFRNEALPLIDEELFAPMYCADNGRPNRAVQPCLPQVSATLLRIRHRLGHQAPEVRRVVLMGQVRRRAS